jgi:uncharacterized protein (DUF1778 family)
MAVVKSVHGGAKKRLELRLPREARRLLEAQSAVTGRSMNDLAIEAILRRVPEVSAEQITRRFAAS